MVRISATIKAKMSITISCSEEREKGVEGWSGGNVVEWKMAFWWDLSNVYRHI